MSRPKRTRRNIDRFVAEHRTDALTLDIGCRRAPYSHLFPNRVGLDLRRGKRTDLVGDACALPLRSGSIPCALMVSVLEHILEPEEALREILRVLEPGGRLIMSVPYIYPIHDAPDDFHRWTHHGLRALLRRGGFEIQTMQHDHGTLETISLMLHRIGLQATASKWSPKRWVLSMLSATVGLFSRMRLEEFGDKKGRHSEEAILTAGYLVVARRPAAPGASHV